MLQRSREKETIQLQATSAWRHRPLSNPKTWTLRIPAYRPSPNPNISLVPAYPEHDHGPYLFRGATHVQKGGSTVHRSVSQKTSFIARNYPPSLLSKMLLSTLTSVALMAAAAWSLGPSPNLDKRVFACPTGTLVCCHVTRLQRLHTAEGCASAFPFHITSSSDPASPSSITLECAVLLFLFFSPFLSFSRDQIPLLPHPENTASQLIKMWVGTFVTSAFEASACQSVRGGLACCQSVVSSSSSSSLVAI